MSASCRDRREIQRRRVVTGDPTLPPEVSERIDAFCDQLWLRDGLAQASLAAYRRDLAGWAARADALRERMDAVVAALEAGDTEALAPGFVLSGAVANTTVDVLASEGNLRKIAAGETEDLGDISTLADPSVVERLLEASRA